MSRIIAGLILGALLVPVVASAVSVEELQAQIQQLLARVAELQKQLVDRPVTDVNTSVVPSAVKHRICLILTRSLSRGQSGDDVRGLQEFLRERGHLSADATGFFGTQTEQGLMAWQRAEGVDAVGVFGPISRGRIRIWCGGGGWVNKERFEATPVRGDAPLAVTFSTWISGFRAPGTSYTINFGDGTSEAATSCSSPADFCVSSGKNTHTYASNGTYNATLVKKTTNTCTGTSELACAAWESKEEVVGKQQIRVGPIACTLEYNPVCGSKQVTCITTPCNPVRQTYGNRCAMEADGATFVHAGQCEVSTTNPKDDPQCKRWKGAGVCSETCSRSEPGGVPMCAIPMCAAGSAVTTSVFYSPAQCLEYFSRTGTPVISSLSGPTTLEVGATGTWTVSASDPEGGTLTYNISWGDTDATYNALLGYAGLSEFIQQTTFTHVYSSAGVYTIAIVAKDSQGLTARTTTTVRVGSPTVSTSSCQSGGVWYDEGYKTSTIINANGTVSNIADAYYVCRSGQWKVEGGLQTIACPADAMQCPNGQWVGRTGPNCQFVCPSAQTFIGQQCEVGWTLNDQGQCTAYTANKKCTYGSQQYDEGASSPAGIGFWTTPHICRNGQWVANVTPEAR